MEKNSVGKETMLSEKYAHLVRIECREACQDKLVAWGKRKFWTLSIIFSIVVILGPVVMGLVGFFGGKNLIGDSVRATVKERLDVELKSVERAIVRAEDAIDETREAATRAEERATVATAVVEDADRLAKGHAKTVSELQQTLMTAQNDLDTLRQRINTVVDEYANLTGETGHVKGLVVRDVNSLTARLTALEEFVRRLAKETTGASPEALLVAYETELRKAVHSTEKQKEQFEENAKYYIRLYYHKGTKNLSDRIFDKLSVVGFKASSLDMARAKERLWPVDTRTPYTQDKIRQTLGWFSDNIITYTADVDRKKVDEVVDLIGSVDAVGDLKVLTWEFFVKRYGDPFLAQISPSEFLKTNLIEVYLARSD